MLTDEQKVRIRENDILTDWDEVMINKHSAYIQALAYFSYLHGHNRINFIRKLVKNYKDYKKNNDVSAFYSVFAGCPVEILDKTIYKYTQNIYWDELIDKENFERVGIVSQNNHRIILKYLNLNLEKFKKQNTKVNMVDANRPESKNGIYTGNVEIRVNNNNLVDFVREKDYIHGKYEKKILESFGDSRIHIIDEGHGLYIGTKQQYFIKSPLKTRNAYK